MSTGSSSEVSSDPYPHLVEYLAPRIQLCHVAGLGVEHVQIPLRIVREPRGTPDSRRFQRVPIQGPFGSKGAGANEAESGFAGLVSAARPGAEAQSRRRSAAAWAGGAIRLGPLMGIPEGRPRRGLGQALW